MAKPVESAIIAFVFAKLLGYWAYRCAHITSLRGALASNIL